MTEPALSPRIPVLIVWNGISVTSVALFVFGWHQRDEIITRRVPVLVLVHAIMCCLVGNLCVQTLFYDDNAPALTTNVEWFFILSAFLPLWAAVYSVKALVHITDHFTNVRNLHESSSNGNAFDWRIHLNWSERQCHKLIWHLTPRGLIHEDDIIHSRWYQGNATIYHILCPLLVSFGVYVPIGLAWSGCFSSSTFPQCVNNPAAYGIAYYPQFISIVAWLPAMSFLVNVLRRVPDRLLLVAEHVIHYFIFILGVIVYWILHFIEPGNGNSSGIFRTVTLWVAVSMSLLVSTSLPALLAASRRMSGCCAARRSAMQQTTDSFQRLLADKELFSQFKKVLAEHFSLENGLFWDEFRELEQLHAAKKADQSVKEALNRLYFEYVPPGAPRELNLMSRTREAVIRDYNNGCLTIRSFDPVKKEVFDMMYSHSLPQFLQQQQLLQSPSSVPGSSSGGRSGVGKRRSVAMASP